MLDATGNIILNLAGYFAFSLTMDGEDLSNADIKLHVDQVGLVLLPVRDPAHPDRLTFTFTTEHAAQIGTKERAWILREVVAGVPSVILEGGTIVAEGFKV